MGGGTPVKDTPLGVAKRILDRGDAAHTIKVQSEGEKLSRSRTRVPCRIAPAFHPHCLWAIALCTFGFVIKGAAILTADSCRHRRAGRPGFARSRRKCGFRTTYLTKLLCRCCGGRDRKPRP
jgi:hypothetical protein